MSTIPESTPRHTRRKRAYKGLPLEGLSARWYAKTTGKNLADYRKAAELVAAQVARGGSVLEVAPGPGYLAIELAKLGTYRIVGLDISKAFVAMATTNAARAGVSVTFCHGDVAALPFEANSFDFIVCRAAFKNFPEPIQALNEMYRVLKPAGKAVIYDLRSDAAADAINTYVRGMNLGRVNAFVTKLIFKHFLLKLAYSQERFRHMAAESWFKTCEIQADLIGLAVTLTK
jgi:ubiquinone/menaquinone biosynthesis C-methylase UbiE